MKKLFSVIIIALVLSAVSLLPVMADSWDEPVMVDLPADSENAGCYSVTFTMNNGFEDWQYACAKEPKFGANVKGLHVHTQFILIQSQDLELSAKPGWHWELKTKFLDREAWYLVKN